MKIDTTDIVGANEIAERLSVANAVTIHVWRTRHSEFPKPFLTLKAGMLWSWNEVETWAVKTKRIKENLNEN